MERSDRPRMPASGVRSIPEFRLPGSNTAIESMKPHCTPSPRMHGASTFLTVIRTVGQICTQKSWTLFMRSVYVDQQDFIIAGNDTFRE